MGAQGKIGRVNDAAPFFPVRTDFVGVLRDFKAVADRKLRAGLLDHLFGFVERVDRQRDDIDVLVFEFVYVRLKIGDLPNAVGSPNATVIDDDRVFAFEIVWNV